MPEARIRISQVEHSCSRDQARGVNRQHVIEAIVALDGTFVWPHVAGGVAAEFCPWCGEILPKRLEVSDA